MVSLSCASTVRAGTRPATRRRRRRDAEVDWNMVCLITWQEQTVTEFPSSHHPSCHREARKCGPGRSSLIASSCRRGDTPRNDISVMRLEKPQRFHSHASFYAMKICRRHAHTRQRSEFRQPDVRTPHVCARRTSSKGQGSRIKNRTGFRRWESWHLSLASCYLRAPRASLPPSPPTPVEDWFCPAPVAGGGL